MVLLTLLAALAASAPQSGLPGEAGPCVPPPSRGAVDEGVAYAGDLGDAGGPCASEADASDRVAKASAWLKRVSLARNVAVSMGGELRVRYHDEGGIGASRLEGLDDAFALTRLRVHADVWITEHVRGFVEAIDGRRSGGSLPPRASEVVRTDVLNGFAELGARFVGGRAYVRGGRQELLFGAQRLISPLDWGNTRRTFDGVRAGYEAGAVELHGWFVHPRSVAGGSSRRDRETDFSGLYGAWRPQPGQAVELFALNLEGDPLSAPDSDFWTLGGRLAGERGRLLWEMESAHQIGSAGSERIDAVMWAGGLGLDLSGWLPEGSTFRASYDRASGDGDGEDGERRTFHQLFPLAHAFLGAADVVGRRNIEAVAVSFTTRPHPRGAVSLTLHDFRLVEATDALYNAQGDAIRLDPTGAAGTDVGRELDAALRLDLRSWLDVELGYARFRGGDFIERTDGAGVGRNADFFYLQTSFPF